MTQKTVVGVGDLINKEEEPSFLLPVLFPWLLKAFMFAKILFSQEVYPCSLNCETCKEDVASFVGVQGWMFVIHLVVVFLPVVIPHYLLYHSASIILEALAPLLLLFSMILFSIQNGHVDEGPPPLIVSRNTFEEAEERSFTSSLRAHPSHGGHLPSLSPNCSLTSQLQEYVMHHSSACQQRMPGTEALKPLSRVIVGLQDGERMPPGPTAFLIHAVSPTQISLCHGGNYYEVRIETTRVDNPAIITVALSTTHIDLGNGLHCINFHPADAGAYRADVLLAWEGEPESTVVPVKRKLVNREVGSVSFIVQSKVSHSITNASSSICGSFVDGNTGRWVRLRGASCQEPFCTGSLRMVSREGWVYVPYSCYYHLYERSEAWQCVAGKYLLFTGDSTMQEDYLEFVKQLLNVREGDKEICEQVTCGRGHSESSVGPTWKKFRNYDKVLVNPHDRRQRVRIQMVWNGHPEHYGLHWGLRTYTDPGHQDRLRAIFSADHRPDFVLINSGMHDVFLYNITLGIYDTLANYSHRLRFAIDFLEGIPGRGNSTFIWRATKAPAGPKYRNWYVNPHKYLQGPLIIDGTVRASADYIRTKPWLEYLDAWSLTFPFHWDDTYSDGHHYSATKNKMVEYMYLQLLLNRICQPHVLKN